MIAFGIPLGALAPRIAAWLISSPATSCPACGYEKVETDRCPSAAYRASSPAATASRRLTSSRFHAAFMRTRDTPHMNKLIQTGIAGFAAWKWGGGLIGTIILFLIVYYLLGKL
jgi:hypothetical protein